MIKSSSLPTGIIEGAHVQSFDKDIEQGEIMLMCSDWNIRFKRRIQKQRTMGKIHVRRYRNKQHTKNSRPNNK